MEKIIQANELTKVYGKANEKQTEALKGISFDIEKGEFIGIMGASGSGKSTLLNILSTLDHPTKGAIRINNSDITKLKGDALADFRSREIGFIFQDFNLLENLTASENIAVPLSLQGVKPKIIQQRIKRVAERLSITHILDKYPAAISGGQKQRVAAARALITEPTILFADEPTGALDTKTSEEIMELFKSLNHQGKTIVIVTHDPKVAEQCDRIVEISDGNILYQQ